MVDAVEHAQLTHQLDALLHGGSEMEGLPAPPAPGLQQPGEQRLAVVVENGVMDKVTQQGQLPRIQEQSWAPLDLHL